MKNLIYPVLVFLTLFFTTSSCKKENATKNNISDYSVPVDADGNVYDTVRIGNQVWMKQNLKTAHYRDGSAITNVADSSAWANIYNNHTRTAACCSYAGSSANEATYGKLYNWYAVNDSRGVCPAGWHMPDSSEWTELLRVTDPNLTYEAGGDMKATTLWDSPNTGATDAYGFAALPAGTRYINGRWYELNVAGTFWMATDCDTSSAQAASLHSYQANWCWWCLDGENALSVRCVRDH